MKIIKILCVTILLLNFGVILRSQGNLTIELNPSTPSVGDDIIVKVLAGFTTDSGYKTYDIIWLNNNNLVINMYCWTGMSSSPSSKVIYPNIGQFSEGLYTLIVNLKVNNTFQDLDDLNLYHETDSDTIIFRVNELLGLDTETFIGTIINLFPNPVNEILNFSIRDNSKILNLEISDISGKVIKSFQFSNQGNGEFENSIDISDLNSGVYFCRFSNGANQITHKFIKQ